MEPLINQKDVDARREEQAAGIVEFDEQEATRAQQEAEVADQELFNQLPGRENLPDTGRYSYASATMDGDPMNSEVPNLPNKHVKRNGRDVFGYDLNSGERRHTMDPSLTWSQRADLLLDAGHQTAERYAQITTGMVVDVLHGGASLSDFLGDLAGDSHIGRVLRWMGEAKEPLGELRESEFLTAMGEEEGIPSAVGQMVRTLAPFLAGYGAAGGTARLAGTGALTSEVVGAAAGSQMYDPAEGNIMTAINESGFRQYLLDLGLDEAFMDLLDAKEATDAHGEWAGRLALLVEEGTLGVSAALALSFGGFAAKLALKGDAQSLAEMSLKKERDQGGTYLFDVTAAPKLILDDLKRIREQLPPEDAKGYWATTLDTLVTFARANRHEAWASDETSFVKAAERSGFDPQMAQAAHRVAHMPTFDESIIAGDADFTARDLFAEPPMEPGSANIQDVATRLDERAAAGANAPPSLTDESPENVTRLAQQFAAEVEMAVNRPGTGAAFDWYRRKIRQTHQLASMMFPELATDPQASTAFNYAMAVTSNGQAVASNIRDAVNVYREYQKTGKFPDFGTGERTDAMKEHFALWNTMVDKLGLETWTRLLDTELTPTQIKALGFDVQATGTDPVPVSMILGPKIGGAFFQNLQGNFTPVTVDLWARRSGGRLTGTVMNQDEAARTRVLDRLRTAMADPKAKMRLAELGITNVEGMADEVVIDAARKLYKDWGKKDPVTGKTFVDTGDPAAMEVNRAGREVVKLLDLPVGAPNPAERRVITRAMQEAAGILQKRNHDIMPADVQALMWYWEKDLWGHMGTRQAQEASTDYAIELQKQLLEAGFDRRRIAAAGRRKLAGDALGGGQGGAAGTAGAGGGREARRSFLALRGQEFRDTIAAGAGYRGGDGSAGGAGPAGAGVPLTKASGTHKAQTPKKYKFKNPAGGDLRLTGTAHAVDTALGNKLKSFGVATPKMIEVKTTPASAQVFHDAISKAKAADPNYGAAVTLYDVEDYAGMRLFMDEGAQTGFALNGDDIVSVFKNQTSGLTDATLSTVALAVQQGGRRLDCFDGALPRLYARAGFRPVARVPFNREFAPPDWNYETQGEPDVVFMVYDPKGTGQYNPKEAQAVEDYDVGMQLQQQAAEEVEKANGRTP